MNKIDNVIISVVPGNYKYGKYIMNIYKKRDFVILCISVVLAFSAFFALAKASALTVERIVILLFITSIPFFLTMPISGYFNVYTFLIIKFKHMITKNSYVWKGVNYGESYEKTTEEDS